MRCRAKRERGKKEKERRQESSERKKRSKGHDFAAAGGGKNLRWLRKRMAAEITLQMLMMTKRAMMMPFQLRGSETTSSSSFDGKWKERKKEREKK